MLLGYDFKDPVKWAQGRMSSKKGYRQEIMVSVVVGFAAVAVVVGAQLTREVSTGSLMITGGISFLILDAIVLRGIMYAMALRQLVLGRQPKGEGASDENHQAKEHEN